MTVTPADELTCREVVELVTAYLDDALPSDERGRVDAHLAGCEPCMEYLRQMRLTIGALGRLPEESISSDALSELRKAFRSSKP
ncbi:MAG: anti-sigma factor family protein [Gemmatimonadales bacterium]